MKKKLFERPLKKDEKAIIVLFFAMWTVVLALLFVKLLTSKLS